MCKDTHFIHFLLTSIQPAIQDVVVDGVIEEDHVLWHLAHDVPQTANVNLRNAIWFLQQLNQWTDVLCICAAHIAPFTAGENPAVELRSGFEEDTDCRLACLMSVPLIVIVPFVESNIRKSRRMMVDFPLPLVPTIAQLVPAGTFRFNPCRDSSHLQLPSCK